MFVHLLNTVRPKPARSLQDTYRAAFDSTLSGSLDAFNSELQSFIAATRNAHAPAKSNAFVDTEWLCTQWPDTGFDARGL